MVYGEDNRVWNDDSNGFFSISSANKLLCSFNEDHMWINQVGAKFGNGDTK
jgi:hypothetical protein